MGLNPTRSTLLDFLAGMGAAIRITEVECRNGELSGELLVTSSRGARRGDREGNHRRADRRDSRYWRCSGAASDEGLTIRDAAELRIKETDRIATIAENLRRMGVEAEELPDGLVDSRAASISAPLNWTPSAITASPWRSLSRRCARMANR